MKDIVDTVKIGKELLPSTSKKTQDTFGKIIFGIVIVVIVYILYKVYKGITWGEKTIADTASKTVETAKNLYKDFTNAPSYYSYEDLPKLDNAREYINVITPSNPDIYKPMPQEIPSGYIRKREAGDLFETYYWVYGCDSSGYNCTKFQKFGITDVPYGFKDLT